MLVEINWKPSCLGKVIAGIYTADIGAPRLGSLDQKTWQENEKFNVLLFAIKIKITFVCARVAQLFLTFKILVFQKKQPLDFRLLKR